MVLTGKGRQWMLMEMIVQVEAKFLDSTGAQIAQTAPSPANGALPDFVALQVAFTGLNGRAAATNVTRGSDRQPREPRADR
jgi:hypothetical protein